LTGGSGGNTSPPALNNLLEQTSLDRQFDQDLIQMT
jgi:hypothetical protein